LKAAIQYGPLIAGAVKDGEYFWDALAHAIVNAIWMYEAAVDLFAEEPG